MKPPVLLLIEAIDAAFPGIDYGPGHIVISDQNVEDSSLKFCLDLINACRRGERPDLPYTQKELTVTEMFLRILKRIPEEDRVDQVFQWQEGEGNDG